MELSWEYTPAAAAASGDGQMMASVSASSGL